MDIDLSVKDYEERFLRVLYAQLLSKLSGTCYNSEFVQFEGKPSRQIILGTLAPFEQDRQENKTAVRTNSISVSFLTKNFHLTQVVPNIAIYYRVLSQLTDSNEEDDVDDDKRSVWKKKCISFPQLTLSEEISEVNLNFADIINEIKEDPTFDTKQKINWSAKLSLEKEKYTQNNETYDLITINLENTTERYEKDTSGEYKLNNSGKKIEQKFETCLFDAKLEIQLDSPPTPFKFDYEYEDYEKQYYSDFNTINCHASFDVQANKIFTSHFKIFEQKKKDPKIELSDIENQNRLKLLFEILMNPEKNISLLEEIDSKLREYEDYYAQHSVDSVEYKDALNRFNFNAIKFREGLEVLKNDQKAKKAFEMVQETFFYTNQGKYSEWRLFQIVFVISIIPDIMDPARGYNTAEILHVDTGGGKSEAYFGLVLFSAFYDRLSGKQFGVTAITKFPLRMLSIQQLQRIAELFIWAEQIRKNHDISGQEFSVGYFVGQSDDFPKDNLGIIKALRAGNIIKGKFVEKCPLLHSNTKCEGDILLDIEARTEHIVHKCNKCGNSFKLLFIGEEIYQVLPTFIIVTVDKLAGVATNRRFKLLFGGRIDECPEGHGFIPHNDTCEHYISDKKQCKQKGRELNINFCQGPSLIIQDEMHLIKESFGTIDSHFEGFLETLQVELKGKPFKNIAMTATLCGAKKQINELYKKGIRIFPGEFPNCNSASKKDFFFIHKDDEIHRFIIGLSPNLRENQFASLLTLRYMAEFINDFQNEARRDFSAFSSRWGLNESEYNNLLATYKTYITYHNKKADVHGMSYYLDPVANSKLQDIKIKPEILTGECTLDEIKEIINEIKTFDTIGRDTLLTTFCTNVVSHGVDIEKWNIMLFQGIPRNTSEYIQALSRCGRKHTGLVILWFYPNRVRDQSFYQNFKEYHEILHHHVEPVPIARWANLGFLQTFNSLFCGAILNYFSEIKGAPLYKVDDVNSFFNDINRREDLIKFLEKAYLVQSNELGSEFFKRNIASQVEKRLKYLSRYDGGEKDFFPNALADCSIDDSDEDFHYFRNQFGMRGIQDQVAISPVNNQENNIIINYKMINLIEDDEED